MNKFIRVAIFLLLTIGIVSLSILGVGYIRYPIKYDKIVDKASREYNIKKSLIFAICKIESNFVEDAISSKNARGIMQIMPSTALWLDSNASSEDIENKLIKAEYNIKIGTQYLEYLTKKYNNNMIEVLAAYNAGEGNIDRWKDEKQPISTEETAILNMEDIRFEETRNYVEKVLKCKNYYEKLYNLD